MEELLRSLVEPLVKSPEDINIRQVQGDRAIILELRVNPEDMGRVIGKGGKRAQAIRAIMKAKGNAINERILLDIVD
ncbi:MAG: KH domain-containing protein [Eubacteriales bacterium]|nr:KH domain-containing protein [Clostridiales bacterium]MDY5836155.1 KH domain-containing protein [Eubacteriales bacterium]